MISVPDYSKADTFYWYNEWTSPPGADKDRPVKTSHKWVVRDGGGLDPNPNWHYVVPNDGFIIVSCRSNRPTGGAASFSIYLKRNENITRIFCSLVVNEQYEQTATDTIPVAQGDVLYWGTEYSYGVPFISCSLTFTPFLEKEI